MVLKRGMVLVFTLLIFLAGLVSAGDFSVSSVNSPNWPLVVGEDRAGETEIYVKNTADESIEVSIEPDGVGSLIDPKESYLIEPGEQISVRVRIEIPRDAKPGLYGAEFFVKKISGSSDEMSGTGAVLNTGVNKHIPVKYEPQQLSPGVDDAGQDNDERDNRAGILFWFLASFIFAAIIIVGVFMVTMIRKNKKAYISVVVLGFALIGFACAQDLSPFDANVNIDLPNFTVIYDEFRNSSLTSDFSAIGDVGLQTVSNMTLQNATYGMIRWFDSVDLTLVHDNFVIDLDQYIEIDNNFVFLDTSYFANLASEVNISIYGLSFTNPRILRNGNVCSDPECVIVSYSSGTLKFNTTSLSQFESSTFVVEETPSSPPPPPGGGGGGGGGSGRTRPLLNFSTDKYLVEITVVAGNALSDTVTIENTGSDDLNFTLDLFWLKRFASLSHEKFSLIPTTSRTVGISFDVPEDTEPNVYTGQVLVKTLEDENLFKFVNLILRVLQKEALFDLESELADKTLTTRQKIEPTIVATDIANVGNVQVLMEYFIKDFEGGEEIKIGEETMDVNGQLEFVREFNVPNDLEMGSYVFVAKLRYQNSLAASSNFLRVIDVSILLKLLIVFLILLILAIILYLILVYFDKRIRRIRGLIKEGDIALENGDLKTAVKNYNEIRQIYKELPKSYRFFIQKLCLSYFVRVRNAMLNQAKTYGEYRKIMKVFVVRNLPEIDIKNFDDYR